MDGVNRVTLIGNLGKNVELRRTNKGDPVANLSVACGESWKDKGSGERKQRTEWVNVVIWGALAEIAAKYLHKGSRVYLEGKIQTRKWQDQSGQDRYSTEVVLNPFNGTLRMLDSKSNGNAEDRDAAQDYREASDGGDQKPKSKRDEMNDEIPF